jgi:cell division transport system permease protein
MAFLAALALCASLVAERTAASWRAGLLGGLTVQILPPAPGHGDLQNEINAVISVLHTTPGILHAQTLSDSDTRELIEPWLGAGALVKELPLPRLVDASFAPGAQVDVALLARRLKSAAPDSLVDDHTRWLLRLRRAADAVIWSSLGVLALIALATAAAVTFATRAGLAAHHDIVSILHQMGARAGFIASAFERHYFVSAITASALGALLAGGLFLVAGGLERIGIEAVPFLPPLGLGPLDYVWLLAVPAASGLIALATARLSVLAALARIY